MLFFLSVCIDAITAISVVLLATLGLYVIYGQMRVINMAHGDILMLGAYTTAVAQSAGVPFPIALLAASTVGVSVGLLIEMLIIRHLYGRDNLSTLLATWGVSLCLVEFVRLVFGPTGRYVDPPTKAIVNIYGTVLPLYSLIVVMTAFILVAVLYLIFNRTRIGIALRAVQEDSFLAEVNGVNVKKLQRWTFAGGAGLAAVAGALISPMIAVTPQMGLEFSTRSFLVVITGGFSHLSAPIFGSILVGGSHSLLNSYFGVIQATIGMLAIAIFVVLIRPRGIVS